LCLQRPGLVSQGTSSSLRSRGPGGSRREVGPLLAYGTSNWTTARIDEANAWAAAHGLEGFCVSSQHLSLATQNEEQWPDTRSACDPEIHAWHQRTQTPLLAW
jgi:1-deoxyxylulose-5-phosphate synthase